MEQTLAFDVYGTLINTSGVFHSLQELIGSQARPFMELWRNKQLEYSFRRALMGQYTDFSECTKDALDYCCLHLELPLQTQDKKGLMGIYQNLPIFEDVLPCLERLKKMPLELFAFSNGSHTAVRTLLQNAGILDYFEGVVSVEKTRQFKPNPVVYEHFNKVTASSREHSWLISGNTFDVLGALSYGMKSVWVKRSTGAIFDPWELEPTIIANSLEELPDIFEKIN